MIPRVAARECHEALEDTPVILIHGPRQCGKSTLLRAVAPGAIVTLDDLIPLEFATRDPEGFLAANPPPLAIDEVQRAPRLFLPIKARVDRARIPGSYLLTGSANVLTVPKIADSLAGRMEIIDLLPLAAAEIEGASGNFVDRAFENAGWDVLAPVGDVVERLVAGGFPEPALRASGRRRDAWFAAYVRTILERDVRDLSAIDGLTQMPRLLGLLAARMGTTLNQASLSRDAAIPATTLGRYVDLLSTLFLVHFVPTFSTNLSAFYTKAPKLYLVDTGLACHLRRHERRHLLAERTLLGPLVENFVAMELKKLLPFSDSRPRLTHLRTLKGREVDFVLEAPDGRVFGIEVKAAETVTSSDGAGLAFLRELVPDRFVGGIVIYLGDAVVPIDRAIHAVPLSALWS